MKKEWFWYWYFDLKSKNPRCKYGNLFYCVFGFLIPYYNIMVRKTLQELSLLIANNKNENICLNPPRLLQRQ